jgi:YfiH family protein
MRLSPREQKAIAAIDELFSTLGLSQGRRKRVSQLTPSPSFPPLEKQVSPVWKDDSSKSRQVLQAEEWAKYGWLLHGFSTRMGGISTAYASGEDKGELNLGFTASDSKKNVIENRRLFLEEVNKQKKEKGKATAPLPFLVTLQQIHSSIVHRVGREDGGEAAHLKGDGMMTDEPGIVLGIQTADCIPVLVADTKKKAVAAFHAGWRGTLKRIVENGVGRMRLEFGSKPENLVAAIGPGIGACCYVVGEEVIQEFFSQFIYARKLFYEVPNSDPVKERYPLLFLTARAPGHSDLGPQVHLDLVEANRRQLLDAGLAPGAISVLGHCTNCYPEKFFSYRAAQGFTGRLLSVIGVRK